jgi:hypothetical protein
MIIAHEEVMVKIAEIPEGHKHLRTTIALHDGTSITFQKTRVATLIRAYITVKIHPQQVNVRLS